MEITIKKVENGYIVCGRNENSERSEVFVFSEADILTGGNDEINLMGKVLRKALSLMQGHQKSICIYKLSLTK